MTRPSTGATIEDIEAPSAPPDARVGLSVSGRATGPGRLPGLRVELRIVVLLVSTAVLLTLGFTGRSITPTDVASAPIPTATAGASASSADGPSEEPGAGDPAIALAEPVVSALVVGPVVHVRGAAAVDLGEVRLRVMLGDDELGHVALLIHRGPFETDLPVFAPASALPVRLEVARAIPRAAAILDVPFRLREASPVDVWTLQSRPYPGACQIAASGPAPLVFRTVTVRLSDGHKVLASSRATVDRAATPDGGGLLGEGRWSATVVMATPAAPLPTNDLPALQVVLVWADPSDGMSGSLFVPVAGCHGPGASTGHAR